MNIAINRFICNGFGFSTKFVLASDLGIHTSKERRVIDICKKLDAGVYLSGNGAKSYQRVINFDKDDIILEYTKYQSFEYEQLWKGFSPNLSILDYIFNYGFDWSVIEDSIMVD